MFSDDLKTKLKLYLSHIPKVNLIRLPVSKGLMTSRQTGINNAKSDVIVVMDSHLELAPGRPVFACINKMYIQKVKDILFLTTSVKKVFFFCIWFIASCILFILTGWLEPLVQRIKDDPKVMVFPKMGGINRDTFEITSSKLQDPVFLVTFDFYMAENHVPTKTEYLNSRPHKLSPIK